MKKIENPYYQLNINSFCSTEVSVNDVVVDEWRGIETRGFTRNTSLTPINHVLLQSGKHTVKGKMFPRYGQKYLTGDNSYLAIEFFVANIQNLKNSRITFHPTIESPWDGLTENIQYPYFEINAEIEVELPFILYGWQNSVDLSKMDNEELFKEVLNYYQYLRLILTEHNAAQYLEISQEKMNLQEQAFYFNAERKKSFLNNAAQLFSQKLEVEELIADNLKIEIMGFGKLVKLVRKDGTQALQFKSKNLESQSNIELEIKLHRRMAGKELSII